MSDLRPVDRVMLEKIRRIETHIAWAKGDNEFAARAKDTSALLTEQPEQDEAGECSECGGTGDAPRQRGMSFTDCAECNGTALAPEPELCTHPDCDCVDAENECPKGLKTLAPEPVDQDKAPAFYTGAAWEQAPEPAAPQPDCEGDRGELSYTDVDPAVADMMYRQAKNTPFSARNNLQQAIIYLTDERNDHKEQRDAAEEKLARLEGLGRKMLANQKQGYMSGMYEVCDEIAEYFDKLAAERPTPDTEREEKR